ncbi:MAG: NAD-dependent succinate-semialdehyde dehydrogenase [Pseudomonadota bacterium]
MPLRSINPATEEVVAEFAHHDDAHVERALSQAEEAVRVQRMRPIHERVERMSKAAEILDANRETYARMLTTEMGKTIGSARAEVEKCASVCRYYAEHGPEYLERQTYPSSSSRSFAAYLPLGAVLAVMPWNFPFWQVFRFAAPALVAGNVGLLKHASNVPQCAIEIEKIFREAGFEDSEFQTLLIGSDGVERVLGDRRVAAATLTGSEGAGRAVAAAAGKALKKTVLELGGSDPFIVMPSADMDAALDAAVAGRTMNNGQSCIAAKRFLLHADIHDHFLEAFAERIAGLRVGDPMDEETDVGPLATGDIRDEVAGQVEDSVAAGARRHVGAEKVDGKGFFFRPGVLLDIPASAPAYSEELFGPVALVFKIRDMDEAITLGNATRFGLGSAIFTRDDGEQERAISELDAGATFINRMVASDPRLPFGGVKASGYGRELADIGIREFMNVKTVAID